MITSAQQIKETVQRWYSERLGDNAETARLYGIIHSENEAQMEYSFALSREGEINET